MYRFIKISEYITSYSVKSFQNGGKYIQFNDENIDVFIRYSFYCHANTNLKTICLFTSYIFVGFHIVNIERILIGW